MKSLRITALLGGVFQLAVFTAACGGQVIRIPTGPPLGVSALAWHQVPNSAQEIWGMVLSIDSLVGLPDALVSIADSSGAEVWRAKPNPDGRITWAVPAAGTYTITVRRIGYASLEERVTVLVGARTAFTAILAPMPSHLRPTDNLARPAARDQ